MGPPGALPAAFWAPLEGQEALLDAKTRRSTEHRKTDGFLRCFCLVLGSRTSPGVPKRLWNGPCWVQKAHVRVDKSHVGVFGPSWGAPGSFVAASGARRGCFWALLGRSWRPFGYPWRARRRFRTPKRGGARDIVKHAVLRCFCVVLGAPGPLRGCQNGSGTAHVGYTRPV